MPVAGRYEILDILAQDKGGVVFHAEERESGRSVVLRRFFPYGPDGGGLQEAERAAYMAALDRVKDFRHPTLRTIIDGGCDPVDGMPFLVTEWVEGQRLSELLKSRPLSPGSTKALITHAIEASKELTQAFGEEAVWVEAAPESVLLPAEEGDVITFWICPMKWLASPEERGGLLPLARLAEKALHWRGKPVAGTAEGLGTWVKAVRTNPNRWSLDEALQALHEPLTLSGLTEPGGVPTVPMKAPKKAETKSAPRRRSVLPALFAFLLVAVGLTGGIMFFKSRGGKLSRLSQPPGAAAPQATSALDFGSRDMPAAAAKPPEARPSALSQVPETPTSVAIKPDPKTQLVGKVISVKDVGQAPAKFRCVEVEVEVDGKPRWIAYGLAQNKKGFDTKELEALKGKRILATGVFKQEPTAMGEVLHVSDRKQIELK